MISIVANIRFNGKKSVEYCFIEPSHMLSSYSPIY